MIIDYLERRTLQLLRQRKLKAKGEKLTIHHSVRFKNPQYISIGDNVYLAPNVRIEAWDQYNLKCYTPEIQIHNNVRINESTHIGSITRVEIGEGTLIGSHVLINDHSHGKNDTIDELMKNPADRDLFSKGDIKIGKRVWICDNSVVLPGVTIGDNSIIGANSVINTDVPANCLAAGVPARVIKKLF